MYSIIKFRKSAFIFSLQLMLMTSILTVAENNDSNTPAETADTANSLEQRMQKRISVDFRNTPIDDVIRTLAEQAGVDVVKSPEVTGEVTTTLTNVPLSEALSNILTAHNYGYVTTQNMIRISPIADIVKKSERLTNKIYRITYADVVEIEKGLRKFLSKKGSISANPGTSNIIITDTESKIKAIDAFIAEIDRATPQVLVEVRIYDVTSKDRLDIGVNWNIGTNSTLGSTLGTGEDGLQGTQGGKTNPFAQGTFSSNINKATGSDNTIRFGFLDSSVNIDAAIRAEQENICATLLANPRILVLDNERATFKSVSEIPYQELQETSAGGSIGTTEFREVGVSLEVIPHVVMEDGMIRLRVIPEFSIVTGSVTVGGFTVTSPQPVVDSRSADTTLLVKDRQTIVLGGLRKKEIQQQENKVPLLGDIPGLGWLFKSKGEETVISELVVFITPKIIEKPIMTADESEMLRSTEICSPQCEPTKIDACTD